MTDEKSELFALPSWYDNLEQPQEVPEELLIDLHALPRLCFSICRCCPGSALEYGVMDRSLLFRDRMVNATDKSDEKAEVDSSGDLRTVLEVEVCQGRDELLD